MKKYVVLSVNDNPDYLYFTPLTCWAWRKFGWEPLVMYQGSFGTQWKLINKTLDGIGDLETIFAKVEQTEGYRSDTVTQVSRLYATIAASGKNYLMTGDIDMIPLSDYWKPNENRITVWGEDLTGYTEYPICYIGMTSQRWVEVMGLSSNDYNTLIKRDLDNHPNAKSTDFYKYWGTDQQIITERIKAVNFEKEFIDRGKYKNGYAVGRVDRGAWTLDHRQFIDAHLFQQVYHKGREDKFEQTLDLLEKIWPEENFDWLILYTEEFRKLTGHK